YLVPADLPRHHARSAAARRQPARGLARLAGVGHRPDEPNTLGPTEEDGMFDPISRLALRRTGGVLHEPMPVSEPAPRVTVVVPCYNYGHFLPACVASALD